MAAASQSGALVEVSAGRVLARLLPSADGARLRIEIEPGWHVMAHEPGASFVVPFLVEGPGLTGVRYPTPEALPAPALGATLWVYSGAATTDLAWGDGRRGPVEMLVQTCSADICLPPEKVTLAAP